MSLPTVWRRIETGTSISRKMPIDDWVDVKIDVKPVIEQQNKG